jgi:hypothetical protein
MIGRLIGMKSMDILSSIRQIVFMDLCLGIVNKNHQKKDAQSAYAS